MSGLLNLYFDLFSNYCMFYVCLVGNVTQAPVQLREFIISECYSLRRFPNSKGCLNELKKILIIGSKIESLPEEFCRLQLLEHLELRSCGMLSSLPSSFGDLANLRYVDLQW